MARSWLDPLMASAARFLCLNRICTDIPVLWKLTQHISDLNLWDIEAVATTFGMPLLVRFVLLRFVLDQYCIRLRGRHREFPYNPSPTHAQLPPVNLPQRDVFITPDGPVLIFHYPSIRGYARARSWHWTVYGFG